MRRNTHEQFTEKLHSISPNFEVLSPYQGSDAKIKVRCTTCGETWMPTAHALISGRKCPTCNAKITGVHRKRSTSFFRRELAEISPHIEVLGEYVARKKKILVKCNRCQNQWEVVPASLLDGHDCPLCARKRVKIYNKIRHMEQGD